MACEHCAPPCPACTRKKHDGYRKGTTARRLYTALKQRLRLRPEERAQWTLVDVEDMLSLWHPPPHLPEPKRLRIVPIKRGLPLVPGNARVVM